MINQTVILFSFFLWIISGYNIISLISHKPPGFYAKKELWVLVFALSTLGLVVCLCIEFAINNYH
jgi:hypothetical protein